jgi:hypothetical protein
MSAPKYINVNGRKFKIEEVAIMDTAMSTATPLTASANNWSPNPLYVTRVSATTPVNITGLVAGRDGEVRMFINVGTAAITWLHQSGSSSAENRFITTTALSVVQEDNGIIYAIYDGTSARWRLAPWSGGGYGL